jgi:transcriptional regulator with XRE-family HTH domain
MSATERKTSGRLRAVREAKGESLDAVSEAADLDKGQLSRIERGLQRPTVEVLARLCRVLGLRNEADTIERLWP